MNTDEAITLVLIGLLLGALIWGVTSGQLG